MFVYHVVFKVRSDFTLERIAESSEFRIQPNFNGTFDDWFQELSSECYYYQQVNKNVIHCLRNQIFFCFFVWDKEGKLHLFNSRSEVKRFLKEVDM